MYLNLGKTTEKEILKAHIYLYCAERLKQPIMTYTKGMLRDDALAGKVIVITGGGTGLGRAMGEYFLELGAKLAICGRREEVLAKASEEMVAAKGGEVFYKTCDVRKYDEVEAFRDAVLEKYSRVDVLLNNAAGNFISPTERLSPGAFDAVIDIVLKGTKNCTLAFAKDWISKEQRDKVVLSITTTYANTGSAFVVPSAMAKAGVSAMTRSLAVEWARYGIRFNAIAPGPFPTEGAWSRLMPGDIPDMLKVENQIPLKRAGDLQELANLAAYLVSDFAPYMNGEIVTIDGGEWLLGAGELNFLQAVPDEMWDWIGEATRKGK